MTRFTRPLGLALGVVVCAGLTLTGCGSSGSSTGSDNSGSTPVALKVAVSPTISSVDVLYALNAGIFKKYGLDVTTSVDTSSGAATFAEVLNGQLDMTVVDPMSTILAISKGLPLQIAAEGNVMTSDPSKNYAGIVVKAGSGITSVSQLEGKTVAVVSLDSILQMLAQITVDAGGGDSSQVKFVEVPPGEEVDAVAKGQANAFVNVEPLLTEGEADGLTVLAHPPASLGGLPQDVLVTSKTFAQQDASTVKKFQEAMAEANEALAANPQLIVSTAIAEKEVSASVADKIILPVFSGGTVSADSITKLEDLMIKYGYLKSEVSASTLLGS
jgi:NitT/TauT family transport system substrate-binding protein